MNARRHVILIAALFGPGCADLTAPAGGVSASRGEEGRPRVIAPVPEPAPAPAPAPPPAAAPAAAPQGTARASHVLVAYTGAVRARPEITRSKEEAKKRAGEVLARAKKGDDFTQLAREISDDPTAKASGGDLGPFTADRMVKPFSDAAFALKPGELSDVVETQFGYHVIKRTE
jgi:hypothetical protein